MKKKRVAIVDKTGRGHSICDAFIRNNPDIEIFYIPGTGGVFDSRITTVQGILISDTAAIVDFCVLKSIGLAIVSHIEALRAGIADSIREKGIPTLGVSSQCTELESSKWLCKEICVFAGVPTAPAKRIETEKALLDYIRSNTGRCYMIKADWLTHHGNGAIKVNKNDGVNDVFKCIKRVISQNPDKPFKFVVEDFIEGQDFSAHYIVEKSRCITMPSCLDYKKSHDNDADSNCDGMGSISPHPIATPRIMHTIKETILKSLMKGLKHCGIDYGGPLYLGLRISNEKVCLLEVNTRFGDSESEAMFPRISENLYDIIMDFACGIHINKTIQHDSNVCLAISIVTSTARSVKKNQKIERDGWPFNTEVRRMPIRLITDYLSEKVTIYWGNASNNQSGTIMTGCGRVAHIVGIGKSLEVARERAYSSIPAIEFDGIRWRSDIGAS